MKRELVLKETMNLWNLGVTIIFLYKGEPLLNNGPLPTEKREQNRLLEHVVRLFCLQNRIT